MPVPIANYDDGLIHAVFAYQSDAGVLFSASIRFCYLDDNVVAGGALPKGTPVNKPKALKLRHLILTSKQNANGRTLKRRVPCNKSDVATYFPPGATAASTVTVDGEDFFVSGYHGETWRGSQAPT